MNYGLEGRQVLQQCSSRATHEGLVVVRRGKGAVVWCPTLGMCLLSKSDHFVGQWISFETYRTNVPKKNGDITNLIDLTRHKTIASPVPTFSSVFRGYSSEKIQTPVLFISSFEEAQYFLSECGISSVPAINSYPVFVQRVVPIIGKALNAGSFSMWKVVHTYGEILPIQSSEFADSPKNYIQQIEWRNVETLQRHHEHSIPETLQKPPERIPNPITDAAEAIRRLLQKRTFQEKFSNFDLIAYRNVCRLTNSNGSSSF